ncbi:hypothetical protein H6P81_001135 [Aristolochia fimbriata]|uniref:Uncharacterized protein n=1 Tax=Aristolochia fimbriata TaxID=158543 RepID=A0AAV7F9C1_ARIFI|nr:hypothetical protein H6P81_001135 [Aristolochia fimbriata]
MPKPAPTNSLDSPTRSIRRLARFATGSTRNAHTPATRHSLSPLSFNTCVPFVTSAKSATHSLRPSSNEPMNLAWSSQNDEGLIGKDSKGLRPFVANVSRHEGEGYEIVVGCAVAGIMCNVSCHETCGGRGRVRGTDGHPSINRRTNIRPWAWSFRFDASTAARRRMPTWRTALRWIWMPRSHQITDPTTCFLTAHCVSLTPRAHKHGLRSSWFNSWGDSVKPL